MSMSKLLEIAKIQLFVKLYPAVYLYDYRKHCLQGEVLTVCKLKFEYMDG
jgi:hypothetical protein